MSVKSERLTSHWWRKIVGWALAQVTPCPILWLSVSTYGAFKSFTLNFDQLHGIGLFGTSTNGHEISDLFGTQYPINGKNGSQLDREQAALDQKYSVVSQMTKPKLFN